METLLIELAKISPVIGVLVIAIFYFLKREAKKELVIDALNEELRNAEKENLTALYKLLALIEKMEEKDKSKSDLLLKEIQEMRKSLETRLDNIK